jgi:hypothetical protein
MYKYLEAWPSVVSLSVLLCRLAVCGGSEVLQRHIAATACMQRLLELHVYIHTSFCGLVSVGVWGLACCWCGVGEAESVPGGNNGPKDG